MARVFDTSETNLCPFPRLRSAAVATRVIQPIALDGIAASAVADERFLADVVLVAVVFHRDLQVAVHQIGTGDEFAGLVVDRELTLRFWQPVCEQRANQHLLALALGRYVVGVAFGEQPAQLLRSLAATFAHPAEHRVELVEGGELVAERGVDRPIDREPARHRAEVEDGSCDGRDRDAVDDRGVAVGSARWSRGRGGRDAATVATEDT